MANAWLRQAKSEADNYKESSTEALTTSWIGNKSGQQGSTFAGKAFNDDAIAFREDSDGGGDSPCPPPLVDTEIGGKHACAVPDVANESVDATNDQLSDEVGMVRAEFGGGDDGTALPCPAPERHFPQLSTAGALAHYMSYSGSPKTIPISQVDATPPQPFEFPKVLAAYNSGAGVYDIHTAHSNAIQTGWRSAEILGRITYSLEGRLSVQSDGQFTFAGDISVLPDTYDFDAGNRDPISETSTFVGNTIPGKPYKIYVTGAFRVIYSSNKDGSISRVCAR